MLYIFEYGSVTSKAQAAQWAKAGLGERWHGLIDRALVGRHNPPLPANVADTADTLELGRFVLERVNILNRGRAEGRIGQL